MPTFYVTFINGQTIAADFKEATPAEVLSGSGSYVTASLQKIETRQLSKPTAIAINRSAIAYVH